MKIGIITFQNAHNFGACMQLYALQQYLVGHGHDVTVVNYLQPAIEKSYQVVKRNPSKKVISKLFFKSKYFATLVNKPYLKKRRANFRLFSDQFFRLSEPCKSMTELRKMSFDFDALIMGSDQIWNPGILKKLDQAYFGAFVSDDTLRISYAASIGADLIPENYKEIFKLMLRKVDYISVREQSAKREVEALTEKPVTQVVDPTFLADKSIYDVFSSDQRFNQDYIYVHVHHYTAKAPNLVRAAQLISQKTGLPIVHNIHDTKFDNQIGTTYSDNPEKTISIIKNAKYILSQSFHITAFAIIFSKTFFVLQREKYNSRINGLLDNIGLTNLYITDVEQMPDIEKIMIDYSAVNKKLIEMRKKSVDYLNISLSGNKVNPKG